MLIFGKGPSETHVLGKNLGAAKTVGEEVYGRDNCDLTQKPLPHGTLVRTQRPEVSGRERRDDQRGLCGGHRDHGFVGFERFVKSRNSPNQAV